MNRKIIIGVSVAVVVGIATFFIIKKIRSSKSADEQEASGEAQTTKRVPFIKRFKQQQAATV